VGLLQEKSETFSVAIVHRIMVDFEPEKLFRNGHEDGLSTGEEIPICVHGEYN
jgi:hypothetical protein